MLLVNSNLREGLCDGIYGNLYGRYLALEAENDRIALSIAKIHSKESGRSYENHTIPFVNLEKGDDLNIEKYLRILDYPKTNPARDFFLFVDRLISFESELRISNIEHEALTAKIDFCLKILKQLIENGHLAARQCFNMCKKGRSNHNKATFRVKLCNGGFFANLFGFDLSKRLLSFKSKA